MEIKTINLKGKSYAPVGERINAFQHTHKNASIKTSYDFKEGWCIFKAKVTPDLEKSERFFTGHSMGKVGTEKALEKLETVAIGRALAIAGFAPDGTIASYEEMEKFNGNT
jgi:hypothetical protein